MLIAVVGLVGLGASSTNGTRCGAERPRASLRESGEVFRASDFLPVYGDINYRQGPALREIGALGDFRRRLSMGDGAGGRTRTCDSSVERWHFTVELLPLTRSVSKW